MPELAPKAEKVFRGIPASAGVCRGTIFVLGRSHATIPRHEITPEQVPGEITRLERALIQTRHDILEVQHKVSTTMGAQEGGSLTPTC